MTCLHYYYIIKFSKKQTRLTTANSRNYELLSESSEVWKISKTNNILYATIKICNSYCCRYKKYCRVWYPKLCFYLKQQPLPKGSLHHSSQALHYWKRKVVNISLFLVLIISLNDKLKYLLNYYVPWQCLHAKATRLKHYHPYCKISIHCIHF